MAARSLNKVQLIGNLTRDPELRYTPTGAAVCTFGIATNRQWATESGEKKEEADFHRIVAWNKLAEICSQLLAKGRRVYIEGRLSTRSWQGQDGAQRQTTEVVASDMIVLDSRGFSAGGGEAIDVPEDLGASSDAGISAAVGEVESTAVEGDAANAGEESQKGKKGGKTSKKPQDEEGEEMPF